jgi:phage terminase small subunit
MAYRTAGYSPQTQAACDVTASKLLRNPKIWLRIQWLRDENLKYVNMHRIEAVTHLRNVAMAKVTDFFDDAGKVRLDKSHPLADAVLEYIEEEKPNGTVKRRLKLKDSLKAIDMLGLSEPQRIDHTTGGKPISTVIQFVDGTDH